MVRWVVGAGFEPMLYFELWVFQECLSYLTWKIIEKDSENQKLKGIVVKNMLSGLPSHSTPIYFISHACTQRG